MRCADGLFEQQPLTALALSYMRRASAAALHASSALRAPTHAVQAASAYVADATAYVAAERKALMAAALGWASWPIAVAARPITVRWPACHPAHLAHAWVSQAGHVCHVVVSALWQCICTRFTLEYSANIPLHTTTYSCQSQYLCPCLTEGRIAVGIPIHMRPLLSLLNVPRRDAMVRQEF